MNGDQFHSQLMILLKNGYEDIERAKQMQWRDFYNVLFAIGAVTGLYRVVYGQLRWQWVHLLFFLAPLVLGFVGFWLIQASQDTLQQRRNLIENGYYPHLDQNIRKILESQLAQPLNRDLHHVLYRVIIAITAVFGILIMVSLASSDATQAVSELVPTCCQSTLTHQDPR